MTMSRVSGDGRRHQEDRNVGPTLKTIGWISTYVVSFYTPVNLS